MKKIITTTRFILRPLCIEDVTERYCAWLNNQDTGRFIVSKLDIAELRHYVTERLNRENILFLGIFDKKTGIHIGNIKYEPINSTEATANMGILIGEAGWRGCGVAVEVILASSNWLYQNRNIRKIILGVNKLNSAAIRAYLKVGFLEKPSVGKNKDSEFMSMELTLSNQNSMGN